MENPATPTQKTGMWPPVKFDPVKGEFKYTPSNALAGNGELPAGWFAVSHRWMGEKTQRRRAHDRWFKITCSGRRVSRVLRFSANLKGSPS